MRVVNRERQSWRCKNCAVWGTAVWAVRDGPDGPRVSVFPQSVPRALPNHRSSTDTLP